VAAAHLGALNADTDRPRTMEGNRFLFVVETSATSSRLDHGGRQALVDLIYTGVYGQMRTGDTFGLWSFNEQVFAGVYPMQTWDSENTMELASNAGQFLKGQRYHKKGRFEPVVQEVLGLVRGIKDVNIFIISDSETRPPADAFGPAFDREYAENIARLPNTKTPLITTIVGRNGSISNWLVTVGSEPIRLPAFAILPRVAPKPAAPATVAKVEPIRPRRSPIIIKRSSPATPDLETDGNSAPNLGQVISSAAQMSLVRSSQTNRIAAAAPDSGRSQHAAGSKEIPAAMSVANQPFAVTMEPNAGKNSETSKTLPAPRQSVPAKFDAPQQSVAKSGEAKQEQRSALPQEVAKQTPVRAPHLEAAGAGPDAPGLLTPEPIKVAARERMILSQTNLAHGENARATPLVAEASGADRLFSPAAMVVIGGLLLILAGALGILLLQRMRRAAQPSFITQSIEGR